MQKNFKNGTIILIGMMGAGKSTVGRLLAKKTGFDFIDLDTKIEETSGRTISEIFGLFGEEEFRNIESKAILDLPSGKNLVVSTGGGVIEREENIENLKKRGHLYYLKATAGVLFERIKEDNSRPLLRTENPKKTIAEILEKREKRYNSADFIINTENKKTDEITEEILKIYGKING